MPSKNVPNIGASWRKPVCKHRVLPRHPVNPESDSLQTSSLHLSPLLFSFYFGEGVERSVALSDRDPSRLERFLQEPGLLMFNSVLVTERSTACYASILEPVMEHMSGLRRADGGGETIGEGGEGERGFIVLSVLQVDRNDGILEVDRARNENGIFDVGRKESLLQIGWKFSVIRLAIR